MFNIFIWLSLYLLFSFKFLYIKNVCLISPSVSSFYLCIFCFLFQSQTLLDVDCSHSILFFCVSALYMWPAFIFFFELTYTYIIFVFCLVVELNLVFLFHPLPFRFSTRCQSRLLTVPTESLLHGPTWVLELLCANLPFPCYLLSSLTFFSAFFMHGAPLFQNLLPRVIPWAASYAGCPDLLSSLAFSLSFPELHLAEHVLSLNCLACLLWWLSWRVWERVVVNAKWTISKARTATLYASEIAKIQTCPTPTCCILNRPI